MAKPSHNEIELIGGLGRTPELKATPKGKAYCNLAVATTDGTGDYKKTNWHKVVLWGTAAENACKYLVKGSLVYLKGNLTYNEWEKHGQKMREAVITAFKILYLGSPGGAKPAADEPDPEMDFVF